VVTGDITQTDLPRGARSGLKEALRLLDSVEGVAICHFSDVDVVRHPLVQRIVVAYEKSDAERSARERPSEHVATPDENEATPAKQTET
jgi:phosphate starvation-inducible PhoH-like protein